MKVPKSLAVDAKITSYGIDVFLNKARFPIKYPLNIWKSFPKDLKEVFKDNIAHSSTIFIPQILNKNAIHYKTARPLSETFLYKNGIYDMACSAHTDGASSTNYVKRFYNTRFTFEDENIKTPKRVDFKNKLSKRIIIPFSFGKESMLSYLLAKEVGLEPILVSVNEPVHTYELKHKKKIMTAFLKKFNVKLHSVDYGPGIMRYGRYWGLDTELGTGLWVTDYSLLSLPFIHYYGASYIALGNEQSCNDVYYDDENMLTFRSAYDQFKEWTTQLALLMSYCYGKRLQVTSFVEPLYELAETKILHGEYPEYARYQISCFAIKKSAKNNRWCQDCSKCAYLYPAFTAFNLDPKRVGFTENLFDKKHAHLYKTFFKREKNSHYYGSQGEMAVAFYLSMQNGHKGFTLDRFKKELLPKFNKNKKNYFREYLGIHETKNIPDSFKKTILKIYKDSLKEFLV